MEQNSFRYTSLFLLIIFPLLVFLSFNKHSKDKYNTYHSVFWADASGYYVYLPMTFIYNNVKNYPDSIVEKAGRGFSFNTEKNLVLTKYPCGVALLESPFFLLSHFTAHLFSQEANGFSKIYQWGIMIAAIFYSCLGMFFLSRFLQNYFSSLNSFLYVLALFFATNLYYYTIDATGMSHAFSFFLFSTFLFLVPKFYESPSISSTILISIIYALIVLIRPTNGLIGLYFLFFNIETIKKRIHFFRAHLKTIWLAPLIGLFCFIPQMIYWKRVSGNWLYYSYGSESFSYWMNPQLLKVWFSTNNGFFVYAPIMALSIAGMILMIRKKVPNGIIIGVIFLLASYCFASWWNWWFGCSYGSRSFVEFYALLVIPMAWFLESLDSFKWNTLAVIFILLCVAVNMDIIYYYDGCFWGGDWDWSAYMKLHK